MPSRPTCRAKGIGTQLLFAVLGYLPDDTKEVWVFTGQNSKHNIALYNKAGYDHQFDEVSGDLTYAYLRKVLEAGASSTTASRRAGNPGGRGGRDAAPTPTSARVACLTLTGVRRSSAPRATRIG